MTLLFVLSAHAAELEAVVFPGDPSTGREVAEARLAALEGLDPPPVSVLRDGRRMRVEVAPEQVASLVEAGWDAVSADPSTMVAQARAAWERSEVRAAS